MGWRGPSPKPHQPRRPLRTEKFAYTRFFAASDPSEFRLLCFAKTNAIGPLFGASSRVT